MQFIRVIAICGMLIGIGALAACQATTSSGSPGDPGFDRLPYETSYQCRQRLYPDPEYDSSKLDQCVKACNSCYTTSQGSGCDSYCRGIGAK